MSEAAGALDAAEARRLIDHPLIVAAWRALEADCARASLTAPTLEEREEARAIFAAANKAFTKLRAHIEGAAMAGRRRV